MKFFYTLKRTPATYKVGYKMRLLPRGGTLREVIDTVPHGWNEIDIYNGWMSKVPHLRVNHEGWETLKARLQKGEMVSSF